MRRIYDQWAGNHKGTPEDETKCISKVAGDTGWRIIQCSRKRGYGLNGEYCKQHAKIEERRLKQK